MAKLTKKIRIDGYDVLKNEFKISFQLSGFDDHLRIVSTYTYPGQYGFAGNSEHELAMLGFSADEIEQIVEEIFNWSEKPWKALDGLSHGYTMRSRFEVTERLEHERRGKAEAERIIAAAPPLDWAMSVMDEEDEPGVVVGADVQTHKPAGRISGAIALFRPEGSDEFKKLGDVSSQTITYADGVTVTQYFDKDIVEVIDEELDKHRHSIRAIQAAVDRIVAMETAGLGEEPVKAEVPDDWEVPTGERPTIFVDALNAVLPRLVDDVGANLGYLFKWPPLGFDDRNLKDAFRQTFEDAFKIASPGRSQLSRAEGEARYQARRKIAEGATDNAVNAIHTQARRFTDGMTMREHDFLRSIIQEEIEKVVGSVL